MPTNKEDVQNYLNYALLQLGAESYLHGLDQITDPAEYRGEVVNRWKYGFNDSSHKFIQSQASNGADTPSLPAYNRMVETQASALFDKYEIIDHHANDATGFAVTLFRSKVGEYVLSFRSLESRPWKVAGDAERDNDGASRAGIFEKGFAFAQLASMEDYWKHISNGERWIPDAVDPTKGRWNEADPKLGLLKDHLNGGGKITTTGYSLGGHLATVFTLMHDAQIDKTYTYNAAGHGVLTPGLQGAGDTNGATIKAMLEAFTQALLNPELTPPHPSTVGESGLSSILGEWTAAKQRKAADPSWDPFATENGRLNEPPQQQRDDAYKNPRYAYAMAYVQSIYPTSALAQPLIGAFFSIGPTDLLKNLFGNADYAGTGAKVEAASRSDPVRGDGYDKIAQIFGRATHDDYQIVANSQRHSANEIAVLIEDQPDVTGNGGLLPINNREKIIERMLAGEPTGDIGATHSLILIIDSLSLVAGIQTAVSSISEINGVVVNCCQQAARLLTTTDSLKAY